MRPKITFLVHDVHAPTVGAAVRIARVLREDFDAEIVGPDFGYGVCSLYRNEPDIRAVPCRHLYRLPDYWWESRRVERAVSGDLIIALKAYADTLPLALCVRRKRALPVVAYLDEWDGAAWQGWTAGKKVRTWLAKGHHLLEEHWAPWVEKQLRHADAVVCSSSFLSERFRGKVIPMGVDTDFFKPADESSVLQLKKELGLEGRRLIVFGGVVRPHKGVEALLEGMALLKDPALCLLVAGPLTDHLERLMAIDAFKGMIFCAGDSQYGGGEINARVHREMPLYLSLGDVLVVPLADTPLSRSQVPIKLFEAMAMERPVLGNAVSDIPQVLNASGWVVPPARPKAWADALQEVFEHPGEARKRALDARAKCVQGYALQAVRKQWLDVLHGVEPSLLAARTGL